MLKELLWTFLHEVRQKWAAHAFKFRIPFLDSQFPSVLISTLSSLVTYIPDPLTVQTLWPDHLHLFHQLCSRFDYHCIILSPFCFPNHLLTANIAHPTRIHLSIRNTPPCVLSSAASCKPQTKCSLFPQLFPFLCFVYRSFEFVFFLFVWLRCKLKRYSCVFVNW